MAKVQPQDQYHIKLCEEFCEDVETLVRESNEKADTTGRKFLRLNYIESVLLVAEKRHIEPDFAATYLSPIIKEKLRHEYEIRHMLPKSARLPFA
jgi:hypothetical protein